MRREVTLGSGDPIWPYTLPSDDAMALKQIRSEHPELRAGDRVEVDRKVWRVATRGFVEIGMAPAVADGFIPPVAAVPSVEPPHGVAEVEPGKLDWHDYLAVGVLGISIIGLALLPAAFIWNQGWLAIVLFVLFCAGLIATSD